MSRVDQGDPHPLCECPEVTFGGGPSEAQVEACRERSRGVTHLVLGAEELLEFQRAWLRDRGCIHPADSVAAAAEELR